jgi:hypothetical protein
MIDRYPEAKREFRQYIKEEGEERGHNIEIQRLNRSSEDALYVCVEDETLFRIRASVNQEDVLRFKLSDEIKLDPKDVNEDVFTVFLDLHDGTTWNPDIDDFYPNAWGYLNRDNPTCNETITINLSDIYVDRLKNDLGVLLGHESCQEKLEDISNLRIIQMKNKLKHEVLTCEQDNINTTSETLAERLDWPMKTTEFIIQKLLDDDTLSETPEGCYRVIN